jgi:hypothetical protein
MPVPNEVAPARPAAPPRRAKHLMDPDNPRPARRDPMSLDQVQRWIISTLAVTTILHFSAGIVVAAVTADRPDARIGLTVLAGVAGVGGVAAGLAIHRQPVFSWWLLLGWLPTLVSAYFVFWA